MRLESRRRPPMADMARALRRCGKSRAAVVIGVNRYYGVSLARAAGVYAEALAGRSRLAGFYDQE